MYSFLIQKIAFSVIFFIFSKSSVSVAFTNSAFHREKRYLVFPPTAPTRHQLIVGVGIPLDLEEQSVTSGWVIKAQYFLPINATQWRPSFNTWPRDKRDVSTSQNGPKIEKYEVEAVVIEDKWKNDTKTEVNSDDIDDNDIDESFWKDDEDDAVNEDSRDAAASAAFWGEINPNRDFYNADNSRWIAYKGIEALTKNNGFGGRACVLRAICEAADAPFTHNSGLFGELFHILLTPSTTKESISQHSDNQYLRAEELGKSGAPCDQLFSECNTSLLDIFTSVHDPSESLLSFF